MDGSFSELGPVDTQESHESFFVSLSDQIYSLRIQAQPFKALKRFDNSHLGKGESIYSQASMWLASSDIKPFIFDTLACEQSALSL